MQTETLKRPQKRAVTKPHAAARAAMPASMRKMKADSTINVPIDDPAAYGSTVRGDCLAPSIVDGDIVIFSPSIKVQKGMFVGIFFKNGGRWIKRLASDLPPPPHPKSNCQMLMTVEMTNPQTRFFCDPDKTEAVHAVVGIYRDDVFISLTAKARAAKSARAAEARQ